MPIPRRTGGWRDADLRTAQLRTADGTVVTAYTSPEIDREIYNGPLVPASGVDVPDPLEVHACMIECRSEYVFAELVKSLALELQGRSWILDGDGLVWDAGLVDPRRVRL